MQVKLVWRHFNPKFVFKYDRNTVVHILKKQGVPAPWVIIHLLYHSSHILRTRESLISFISEFHSTLRLKIHFAWLKYCTEINKTEWSWRHSFRITHEHKENCDGTSLNSWDKAHGFFEVNELVGQKAKINKQWTDSGEGFGGHVINKFCQSLCSSYHFKPKKAIQKILTTTRNENYRTKLR